MLNLIRLFGSMLKNRGVNKTLGQNRKSKVSYRKNTYFLIHHSAITKHALEFVYTKYEAIRSITQDVRGIQLISPQNSVFCTLITDMHPGSKNRQTHNDSPTGEFFQRLDGRSNGDEAPERGRVTDTYRCRI